MDLRQRKRMLNMPKFNTGSNDNSLQFSYQSPYDYSFYNNSFSLNKPISIQNGYIGNTGTDNYKPINSGITKDQKNSAIGDKVSAIGGAALNIGTNLASSLSVQSTGELVNNAGQSNNSVMGVNYQEQNAVDGSQELKEQNSKGLMNTASSTVSGAATGAKIGGPWGAVVGGVIGLGSGLFGWLGGRNKLRKRIMHAKMAAANKATLQRSNALSQGLNYDYYLNNDNTTDDILYS